MSESKPSWAGAREGIESPALSEVLDAIVIEIDRAIAKHGPWPNSCHHGHSVLLEEVEELWDEIKADKGRLGPAKREAIQVAAVAVRYVMELCYHEQPAPTHCDNCDHSFDCWDDVFKCRKVLRIRPPAKDTVLGQLTAERLSYSSCLPVPPLANPFPTPLTSAHEAELKAAKAVAPRCIVCGKMCDDGKRFCSVCTVPWSKAIDDVGRL